MSETQNRSFWQGHSFTTWFVRLFVVWIGFVGLMVLIVQLAPFPDFAAARDGGNAILHCFWTGALIPYVQCRGVLGPPITIALVHGMIPFAFLLFVPLIAIELALMALIAALLQTL